MTRVLPGWLKSGVFGRLALGFLALSTLSGLALVPTYDPAAPYASLEAITAGLPWAWFMRALHWFTSQALLVTTALHLLEVVLAKRERRLEPGPWWRASASLVLIVLALFSGFLMRGDLEAVSASRIASAISLSLPWLGASLRGFLFGGEHPTVGVIAMHHAGTFTVLLWIVTYEHGGRALPDARSVVLAGASALVFAALATLPLGPAPNEVAAEPLLGPWYFLGLQGMVRDLPPLSVWLLGAAMMASLGTLHHFAESRRPRQLFLAFVAVVLLANLVWGVAFIWGLS
ncbi:MAG: hypothetical protein AUK47_14640 [Deltaproteobacteria bacterium CG2_30_63_29]|nr:MAG: hypothetical protein AUK47_14640 [Deltaproteobacteria bacterium CG2_30_63_29]